MFTINRDNAYKNVMKLHSLISAYEPLISLAEDDFIDAEDASQEAYDDFISYQGNIEYEKDRLRDAYDRSLEVRFFRGSVLDALINGLKNELRRV